MPLTNDEHRRVHAIARQWLVERGKRPIEEFLADVCRNDADDVRDTARGLISRIPTQPASAEHELDDLTGKYQLNRLIGSGASADVYAATELNVGRRVALKVIRTPYSVWSDADKERFIAEVRAAARLSHPRVVTLLGSGRYRDQPAIVWELINGPSLEIYQSRSLAPVAAASLVRDLADAVAAAHEAGVIHRDLKPANVLIDPESGPMIVDFGVARLDSDPLRRTADGEIVGTPAWMAPEQAAGQVSLVGPACDIYSLGALLYFLLRGSAPFPLPSIPEILQAVIHEPPAPLPPGTPGDLKTIVTVCLEKRPSRRFANARMLHDELTRFLEHRPILSRPRGPFGRLVGWMQRRPLQAAMIAILLTAALISGWFAWQAFEYSAASDASAIAASEQRHRAVRSERRERVQRISQQHARVMDYARQAVVPPGARALIAADEPAPWDARYLQAALAPRVATLRRKRLSETAIVAADRQSEGTLLACADAAGRLLLVDLESWTHRVLVDAEWDRQRGRCPTCAEREGLPCITAIEWLPGNKAFVALTTDGQVARYGSDGERERKADLDGDGYRCLTASTDSMRILAGTNDGRVLLLDAETLAVIHSANLLVPIAALAEAGKDGQWLVASADGQLRQLTHSELSVMAAVSTGVELASLTVCREERLCWAGTADGLIYEFSTTELSHKGLFVPQPDALRSPVDAISYSLDALSSIDRVGRLTVWNRQTRRPIVASHQLGCDRALPRKRDGEFSDWPPALFRRAAWMAGADDEHAFLAVGQDGFLYEFDTSNQESGLPHHTLRNNAGPEAAIVFSGTNDVLLWAQDRNGTLRVIDTERDQQVSVRQESRGEVTPRIVALQDGSVATLSPDYAPALWSLRESTIQRATMVGPEPHTAPLLSLAVSPNDRWLASVDVGGKLIVWDLQSGKIRLTEQLSEGTAAPATGAVSFSPDSLYLAAGGHGQSCRVFHFDSTAPSLKRTSDQPFVSGTGVTTLVWNPLIPGQLLAGDDTPRYTVFDVNRDQPEEFKPSAQSRPAAGISTRQRDRLILLEKSGLLRVHDTEFLADMLQSSVGVHAPTGLSLNHSEDVLAITGADGTIECIRVAPRKTGLDQHKRDDDLAESGRTLLKQSVDPIQFHRKAATLADDGTLHAVVIRQPIPRVSNEGRPLLISDDGRERREESPGEQMVHPLRSIPMNAVTVATDRIGGLRIACRERLPGETAYDGDLLLLSRGRDLTWTPDRIATQCNSGFYPSLFPARADYSGNDLLVHFSFSGLRLQTSVQDSASGNWQTASLAPVGHGLESDVVQTPDGSLAMIYRSDRTADLLENDDVVAVLNNDEIRFLPLPPDRGCALRRIGVLRNGQPVVLTEIRGSAEAQRRTVVSTYASGSWTDLTTLPAVLLAGLLDFDVTPDEELLTTSLRTDLQCVVLGRFRHDAWEVSWFPVHGQGTVPNFVETLVNRNGRRVILCGNLLPNDFWLTAYHP